WESGILERRWNIAGGRQCQSICATRQIVPNDTRVETKACIGKTGTRAARDCLIVLGVSSDRGRCRDECPATTNRTAVESNYGVKSASRNHDSRRVPAAWLICCATPPVGLDDQLCPHRCGVIGELPFHNVVRTAEKTQV